MNKCVSLLLIVTVLLLTPLDHLLSLFNVYIFISLYLFSVFPFCGFIFSNLYLSYFLFKKSHIPVPNFPSSATMLQKKQNTQTHTQHTPVHSLHTSCTFSLLLSFLYLYFHISLFINLICRGDGV